MASSFPELDFPHGLELLAAWQAGEAGARTRLGALVEAALAGELDRAFRIRAPGDRVHVTASVHMLALAILHDLHGVDSRAFYKEDPWRYARINLAVNRLVGADKMYLTWALYAFTCEAVGQKMMYPDKFPPGSDPDAVLITADNWRELATPDFNSGVPAIIHEVLAAARELSGMAPLLQISAPYSLAADIYGQEALLADVVHAPERVNALLDHLADVVLGPWIEAFFTRFPDGWVELSDASGSPFFIGPENCRDMAIRSIRRMLDGQPWAGRVFDCNFRGDFVTQAARKGRGGRRRGQAAAGMSLAELTECKVGVCRDFIMRLEADKVPVDFYRDEAIRRGLPLTCGIGSPQIDANRVADVDAARAELGALGREFARAIADVCRHIGAPDAEILARPWPSHVYFEDISAQSHFGLVREIIANVRAAGALQGPGAGR